MVPRAILQRDSENVHDGVIKGFSRCIWIELLWIIRSGADHVVSVVGGVQNDGLHITQVQALCCQLLPHAARQVDRCL